MKINFEQWTGASGGNGYHWKRVYPPKWWSSAICKVVGLKWSHWVHWSPIVIKINSKEIHG